MTCKDSEKKIQKGNEKVMKKKVLWFLAVFVMVVAMSIGMKGETQAATYISTPKNVSVYNPELDTIYLKWSKVSGAKGYYVYISTEKYNGYKVINVGSKNSVVIKGSNGRTRYYFKVKAYDAVGVVSEDSKIVTRQGRIFGVDVSKHNGDTALTTLLKTELGIFHHPTLTPALL